MGYLDFMLQAGADIAHSVPEGYTSVFVYVYSGRGQVCTQTVKKHDVLQVAAAGPLTMTTDKELGLLLLAGVPIGEKIVQHGPFVMASKQQIQQAFNDYQSGRFLNETCKYVLHKSTGTTHSQRNLR